MNPELLSHLANVFHVGIILDAHEIPGPSGRLTCIIRTNRSKFVFCTLPEATDLRQISFEHAFLDYLSTCALPVRIPSPLSARSGESIVSTMERVCWAYEFIDGAPASLTEKVCSSIGKIMAALHNAAMLYSTPGAPPAFDFDWMKESIFAMLAEPDFSEATRSSCYTFFAANASRLIEVIESLETEQYKLLPRISIHCDWNLSNILTSESTVTGLIDFGNCRVDTPLRDIATFINTVCIGERSIRLNKNHLLRFFREYRAHTVFPDSYFEFLPAVVAAECVDNLWFQMNDLRTNPSSHTTLDSLQRDLSVLNWFVSNSEKFINYLRSNTCQQRVGFDHC
jgi:Ser/Thr protein kinase RdoA (MazF antagonist)